MTLSPLLKLIAPMIGMGALIIGVLAMLKPEFMAKKFGIAADGKALPFVVGMGVRDLFIGFIYLLLFHFEKWDLIAFASFSVGVVAFSDFLMVFKHGERRTAFGHLAGALLSVTYGFILL